MAERVGFEPTCRSPDKTLSRRPRYDHFGTSPIEAVSVKRTVALCVGCVALSAVPGTSVAPTRKIGSFAAAVGLSFYGAAFWRKAKRL